MDEFTPGEQAPDPDGEETPAFDDADIPAVPRPINWNLLSSDDLEAELLALNEWVTWLRRTYGLPPRSSRRTGTATTS